MRPGVLWTMPRVHAEAAGQEVQNQNRAMHRRFIGVLFKVRNPMGRAAQALKRARLG